MKKILIILIISTTNIYAQSTYDIQDLIIRDINTTKQWSQTGMILSFIGGGILLGNATTYFTNDYLLQVGSINNTTYTTNNSINGYVMYTGIGILTLGLITLIISDTQLYKQINKLFNYNKLTIIN